MQNNYNRWEGGEEGGGGRNNVLAIIYNTPTINRVFDSILLSIILSVGKGRKGEEWREGGRDSNILYLCDLRTLRDISVGLVQARRKVARTSKVMHEPPSKALPMYLLLGIV